MKEQKIKTLDKNTAIKVDSLTKIFPLYDSPNHRLKEALHPFRKKYHKEFYALCDISFEIQKGDSLGIIGQNGSGKSTLLKVLSRVLTPTAGTFDISGRVISLLELGAGFNTELSGIENIYFYGTILGFSKKQTDSKLTDILAFADIGQFVYQPLKTYSSGMRARLAFAVASHVDPDILILDEVLAVGDMRFKQKCMRTMRGIIDQKRTVLFVSHSMSSITSFCNKVLWLHEGKVMDFGPTAEVVNRYIGFMSYGMESEKSELAALDDDDSIAQSTNQQTMPDLKNLSWINVGKFESFGEGGATIEKVALYNKKSGQKVESLKGGEWLSLYTKITVKDEIQTPGLGTRILDKRGNCIFTVNNYLYQKVLRTFSPGESIIVRTDFKFPHLMVGKYAFSISVSDGDQNDHVQHHWVHDAIVIEVVNHDPKYNRKSNIMVIENQDYGVQIIE